jgi:hypothetical protein
VNLWQALKKIIRWGDAEFRKKAQTPLEAADTNPKVAPKESFLGIVKRGDSIISVAVREGSATIQVGSIDKVDLIEDALVLATKNGATKGAMYTNNVTSDIIERAFIRATNPGKTWMGGKVTRLPDGPGGFPQFRVDWEKLPLVTK